MQPQAVSTQQAYGGPQQPASVYIKNLPAEADKLYLYEHFARHGAVLSVKVIFQYPYPRVQPSIGMHNDCLSYASLMSFTGNTFQLTGTSAAKGRSVPSDRQRLEDEVF